MNALQELKGKTGIEQIYPNMDSAINDINNLLKSSKSVSIFVQLGRDILSGKGLFYPYLKENKNAEKIRILHCGKNNPYLSENKAEKRGHGVIERWHHEINSVDEYAKQLTLVHGRGRFETRFHNEGYFWRLFILDNVGFIQPYIYPSKNSHRSPVFKFNSEEGSVLTTFKDFFEIKWEENRPDIRYLQDILRGNEAVAVTALLRFGDLFIFVVPSRYISEHEIHIQATGGKVEVGESYQTALEREVKEEIGLKVRIHSSMYTTFIHQGTPICNWRLDENLSPFCISKREPDETTRDRTVEWILLFQCDASSNDFEKMAPNNELNTIVCLSSNLLKKVISGKKDVTVSDIRSATDGSKIIGKNSYNANAVIVPRGMVPFIGANSHINL